MDIYKKSSSDGSIIKKNFNHKPGSYISPCINIQPLKTILQLSCKSGEGSHFLFWIKLQLWNMGSYKY